jgi:hypothetical protein
MFSGQSQEGYAPGSTSTPPETLFPKDQSGPSQQPYSRESVRSTGGFNLAQQKDPPSYEATRIFEQSLYPTKRAGTSYRAGYASPEEVPAGEPRRTAPSPITPPPAGLLDRLQRYLPALLILNALLLITLILLLTLLGT